jgi:hypothetical protein
MSTMLLGLLPNTDGPDRPTAISAGGGSLSVDLTLDGTVKVQNPSVDEGLRHGKSSAGNPANQATTLSLAKSGS